MQTLECLMPAVMALLFVALSSSAPALAHRKGLYATKAEAEHRSLELGCNTTHQNNGRWMPCADERELHRKLREQ